MSTKLEMPSEEEAERRIKYAIEYWEGLGAFGTPNFTVESAVDRWKYIKSEYGEEVPPVVRDGALIQVMLYAIEKLATENDHLTRRHFEAMRDNSK